MYVHSMLFLEDNGSFTSKQGGIVRIVYCVESRSTVRKQVFLPLQTGIQTDGKNSSKTTFYYGNGKSLRQ